MVKWHPGNQYSVGTQELGPLKWGLIYNVFNHNSAVAFKIVNNLNMRLCSIGNRGCFLKSDCFVVFYTKDQSLYSFVDVAEKLLLFIVKYNKKSWVLGPCSHMVILESRVPGSTSGLLCHGFRLNIFRSRVHVRSPGSYSEFPRSWSQFYGILFDH